MRHHSEERLLDWLRSSMSCFALDAWFSGRLCIEILNSLIRLELTSVEKLQLTL